MDWRFVDRYLNVLIDNGLVGTDRKGNEIVYFLKRGLSGTQTARNLMFSPSKRRGGGTQFWCHCIY